MVFFLLSFFFTVCNQAKTEAVPARDGITEVMSCGAGSLSCSAQVGFEDSFCLKVATSSKNSITQTSIFSAKSFLRIILRWNSEANESETREKFGVLISP